MLPKLKPIAIKERTSIVFIERGMVDVIDGAFVVVDKTGIRTHIPVGSIACIMLEPGARLSHAAATLAARTGTLLVWVGEAGVRLYSAGQPGGARSDRLLYQAKLALDEKGRLAVVRKMFELRFKETPPAKRSVKQLQGIEGARVKAMYQMMAQRYGIKWTRRDYNPSNWSGSDPMNQCLSAATACLYGVTEAAILAAGYAPAIGFIHTGKPRSFVFDIADIYKFETVVPVAFQTAAQQHGNYEHHVRIGCRDMFRKTKLLKKIIPLIEQVLAAGGMKPPEALEDAVMPAFSDPEVIGDAGHRT